MVSSISPPIESPRPSTLDRPGFGLPGLDRNASIQRHRPWCVSLCVAQSFSAVRRWSSNNVGPVTMSHPESRSLCGKRAAGAFRKSHVPRPPPRGCGRRRRRSTRIPHAPRAHRFVFLDSCRDADGARRRRPSSPDPRDRLDQRPTSLPNGSHDRHPSPGPRITGHHLPVIRER